MTTSLQAQMFIPLTDHILSQSFMLIALFTLQCVRTLPIPIKKLVNPSRPFSDELVFVHLLECVKHVN